MGVRAQQVRWPTLVLMAVLAAYGLYQRHTGVEKRSQAPPREASPTRSGLPAEAPSEVGFASRAKLALHYEKHGSEFGAISMDEYVQRARFLRDRAVDGPVMELSRTDGVVTRFDRDTGAFIAFDPDRTIRTFFRPNDGEAYFKRQAGREPR